MFTPEQEKFLSEFADQQLAEQEKEAQRIAESKIASDKFIAKQELTAKLEEEKKQEITEALAAFDIQAE